MTKEKWTVNNMPDLTGKVIVVIDFDNLMFEEGNGYSRMGAYGRSKIANLLFTYELQRRLDAAAIDAIAVAAHPGGSKTNLGAHLQEGLLGKIMMPLMGSLMQEAAMGALPTVRAAVDPAVQGGDYFGPGGFMEMTGYPVHVESSAASHRSADQQRLWEVSQQLTGVTYL
jgi:NAD(P)-dependent dehydrogenase (short-subunit alcohol dehydrogenase family)